jgi:Tol biopolymer transport system component
VSGKKRGTTFRFDDEVWDQLGRATYRLQKNQNQIVTEALQDYFRKHKIEDAYCLSLTSDAVVLFAMTDPPTVLEATQRNGLSPRQIQAHYQDKYNRNIRLVLNED